MQYSFHVLNIQYKISKGTDKITQTQTCNQVH